MIVRGLLAAALLSLAATPALAQATRTWVSGVGDDANPCSRTAPCKTFAGAISKTTTAGEINTLDPGSFGALTITKSITIDGHSAMAGVLGSGTNGIVIAGATGTEVVTLRGLTFDGLNTGLSGISITNAAAVHIENCVIFGFTTAAINVSPSAATAVYIKNSSIENNSKGLVIANSGTPTVTVVKSTFFNDVIGLSAAGSALVSVHESAFSGNSMQGVYATNTAQINMDHGLISGNGVGAQGDMTSLIRLSEVLVGHNTTGLMGNIGSFGNNRVNAGNGTNGTPSSNLTQQ
jgi:hypothetical protein